MDQVNMEQGKNKNGIIALLVVLVIILAVLCVLFATGTISFKNNEIDNTKNINQQINEIDNMKNDNQNIIDNSESQSTSYSTWMNYILDQNITNIIINRSRYADNPKDEYNAKVNITTEQLKNIFSKLMNYNLVKYYLQGSGFTYGDILTISYSVNGTNYDVKIANGQLWADSVNLKDNNLLNALENSNHTVRNEDVKDMEGAYFNYSFQGYDNSIFDEYFKK